MSQWRNNVVPLLKYSYETTAFIFVYFCQVIQNTFGTPCFNGRPVFQLRSAADLPLPQICRSHILITKPSLEQQDQTRVMINGNKKSRAEWAD